MYGALCQEATNAINHFKHCHSELCPICGPVTRHIPYVNQVIKDAAEKAIQEVEWIQNAQETFMKDTVKMYQSMTKDGHHPNPKSLQHQFSSLSSSIPPSIPRTIGVWKHSVDSIVRRGLDKSKHKPTKKSCSLKKDMLNKGKLGGALHSTEKVNEKL
jgi:hypothetical protein